MRTPNSESISEQFGVSVDFPQKTPVQGILGNSFWDPTLVIQGVSERNENGQS